MHGKSATPGARAAEIAARQHGVLSIRQLRDAGIGDDAARWQVRNGRLHRLHQGVYAVGHRGSLNRGALDGGGARIGRRRGPQPRQCGGALGPAAAVRRPGRRLGANAERLVAGAVDSPASPHVAGAEDGHSSKSDSGDGADPHDRRSARSGFGRHGPACHPSGRDAGPSVGFRGRDRPHPERFGARLPGPLWAAGAANPGGERPDRPLDRRLPLANRAARGRDRQLSMAPRRHRLRGRPRARPRPAAARVPVLRFTERQVREHAAHDLRVPIAATL